MTRNATYRAAIAAKINNEIQNPYENGCSQQFFYKELFLLDFFLKSQMLDVQADLA